MANSELMISPSIDDQKKNLDQQWLEFYAQLSYLPELERQQIEKAFQVAKEAHSHQIRSTGEPYVTHPLAVARILADSHMDVDTLCASILHDVLEDTPIQKKLLTTEFNEDIAEIVDGVSKLSSLEFSSKAEAQAANYRKMLLAMTKDIRVIIVKLADRLHNMRTLSTLPDAKKCRIAKETLEIYAPLANRLGMHNIFVELEELAFQARYPLRYRVLHNAVFAARQLRQAALDNIRLSVLSKLQQMNIASAQVFGRQKHLFSIYQKMRHKHLSLGEIMDIDGLRILVETRDECYRVLGAMHSLFKPLPGRFKDYIAIPKANGYQSLHTILFSSTGTPLEIQIRTQEMDHYAEKGVAAHWLYKTNESRITLAQLKMSNWLKALIEVQNTTGTSQEFIESVKIDLFPDEVYVFTPKGRILELPGNATPIDFAYAVHTDIGNHCVGVRINRRPGALSAPLANGQLVEIITDPEATPKTEWLAFARTGRARSAIKHFLKEKHYDVSVALGKQLLLNALLSLGETNPNLNNHQQNQLLKKYLYENFEALLAAIGQGQQSAMEVAQTLLGHMAIPALQTVALAIKGSEGMVVKFATCCYPIPGDIIKGMIIKNEGLLIHQDQCPKVHQVIENIIPVYWHSTTEGFFKACLVIDVENKPRVLANLITCVADAQINIQDIAIINDDGVFLTVRLLVLVKDAINLAELIHRLKLIEPVIKVTRQFNN